MSATRTVILAAAQNKWLKERASRYRFVRKSVSRFMPGESLDDAVAAAHRLHARGLGTVFTHLGENIADAGEAESVVAHYLKVLERIRIENLATEISVKPTQLGLDFSPSLCAQNLRRLLAAESPERTLWIDMESSPYVDATLTLYRGALADHPNCGVCLQAYLNRTPEDIAELMPQSPSIRLVKGAYREAANIAVQEKQGIDARYLELAQKLLAAQKAGSLRRAILATHDPRLIEQIKNFVTHEGIPRQQTEVQMLYGIQRELQQQLAVEGWKSSVLVAYGTHWYAWFMRRLAERPANLWLVLRNIGARSG
jgi:proline dehydrogenase